MPSYFRGSDNFDTTGGNAVKAWVNFNGTGTVAIRASGNVSSITDNGTGDYTVNVTNAMADANYSALMLTGVVTPGTIGRVTEATAPATTSVRMKTYISATGVATDFDLNSVAIFR